MNALIPAVCMNPKCRKVFMARSIIGISEGITTYLEECEMGPCPKCGGMGLIPSGSYSNMGTLTLFTPRSKTDRQFLEMALAIAREAISGTIPPEAFQEVATERAPGLSALWKLAPITKQEAYQFWMVVFAAIAMLLMAYGEFSGEPPTQINLPGEIIDAIESSRPDAPGDTHKRPRK